MRVVSVLVSFALLVGPVSATFEFQYVRELLMGNSKKNPQTPADQKHRHLGAPSNCYYSSTYNKCVDEDELPVDYCANRFCYFCKIRNSYDTSMFNHCSDPNPHRTGYTCCVSPPECKEHAWYYKCIGNGNTHDYCVETECGPPEWCDDEPWYWTCRIDWKRSHQYCLNLKCGDPPPDPWSWGDPHFRTWKGANEFEYHGACDMVMLKAPRVDLNIHIRTTIRYDYSFISQVAVAFGKEVFEVASWGEYMLDGMATVDLPAFIGGHPISYEAVGPKKAKKHLFRITMEDDVDILLTSFKDYVSVKVENGTLAMFHDATGLMGAFEDGAMRGRDGAVLSDPEEFAPEWQVRDDEDGVFFSGARAPQYPQVCEKPQADAVSARARRLGEKDITREEAEMACQHWGKEKTSCIQDVMKTGDLQMAMAF